MPIKQEYGIFLLFCLITFANHVLKENWKTPPYLNLWPEDQKLSGEIVVNYSEIEDGKGRTKTAEIIKSKIANI